MEEKGSNSRPAELLRLAKQLPKVELHAHINGCIRDTTLNELCLQEGIDFVVPPATDRSLMQCFDMFDVIHAAVADLDAVSRVAAEAVADFAADNVCYCELRTTPRADCRRDGNTDRLATRAEYVQAVVDGVARAQAAERSIAARLLLSVDRSGTLAAARETVTLAAEFASGGIVVGIDFSGNPNKGTFATFAPVLREARSLGLPVTAHVAELANYPDTEATIAFGPERYGHAIQMTPRLLTALQQSKGAVEICPTSNLRTLELGQDYAAHPTLEYWLHQASDYPLAICTDDTALFGISLSQELASVAAAFHLSHEHLAKLAMSSLDHAFASADVIGAVRASSSKQVDCVLRARSSARL
eukprot:SAG31_NODE_2357_length_5874_cov_4.759827_1_plen_359_part_00